MESVMTNVTMKNVDSISLTVSAVTAVIAQKSEMAPAMMNATMKHVTLTAAIAQFPKKKSVNVTQIRSIMVNAMLTAIMKYATMMAAIANRVPAIAVSLEMEFANLNARKNLANGMAVTVLKRGSLSHVAAVWIRLVMANATLNVQPSNAKETVEIADLALMNAQKIFKMTALVVKSVIMKPAVSMVQIAYALLGVTTHGSTTDPAMMLVIMKHADLTEGLIVSVPLAVIAHC